MGLATALLPGSRWGPVLGGLIAALDPALVYAATHVQVVTIAATGLVATLLGAERVARSRRAGEAVVLGGRAGSAGADRPDSGVWSRWGWSG